MKKKREGWSIVLAGFWNRMIFTPEWVGPRLFQQDEELETVVALLPVLPIIYRDNHIMVEIASTRIVCRARDLDNESALRRSAAVAAIIIDALPETPLQGVGVNFAFREEAPAASLLDLFNFDDNPRWAESGWEIGERKVVRQLASGGDTLNLALTLIDGRLDIDCNFHTDTVDNSAIAQALAPDRIIRLRDQVTRTLEGFYGLQLETDNDV